MRLPKLPGFKNRNRVESAIVNVGRLDEVFSAGDTIDIDVLFARGIVKSKSVPVKVLANGEISKALTVKVDKISGSARAKIEAAGGTVELS